MIFLISLSLISGGFASWLVGNGIDHVNTNGIINVGPVVDLETDLTDFIVYVDSIGNEKLEYYLIDNEIIYTNNKFGVVLYVNVTDGSNFKNIDYINNLNLNIQTNIFKSPSAGSYMSPAIEECMIYPLNNLSLYFSLPKNYFGSYTIPLKSSEDLSLYELATFDNTIGNIAYDVNNNLILDQSNSSALINKNCCVPICLIFSVDTSNSETIDFNTFLYDYTIRLNLSLSYVG